MPPWARDWRVIAGGAGLLGGVAVLLVGGSRGWFFANAPASLPDPAPSTGGGPFQMLQPLLTVRPGRTYFAVLETNGSVSAAASPARVKSAAEGQGFRDVVVFTSRPENFPGLIAGDYYVRGTFRGAAARELPRKTSVFLGSLIVRDAWEST